MDKEEAKQFAKWFPSVAGRSPTEGSWLEDGMKQQRVNLLCFHGAGTDSTVYTGRGSRLRPMPNPLLDFCGENSVRVLAVHLPGRTFRAQEACLRSVGQIAEAVLEQLERAERAARAAGLPPQLLFLPDERDGDMGSSEPALVVAGHSMGALCAFEFTQLLLRRGFGPVPRRLLAAAMIAPDIPVAQRPWRPSKGLTQAELQDECRRWGADLALFQPHVWSVYGPVIEADFEALDRFHPRCPDPTLPHVPITAFYASEDTVIKREAVAGWSRHAIPKERCLSNPGAEESSTATSSTADEAAPMESRSFEIVELRDAGHNFLNQAEPRVCWMKKVIDVLDEVLIDLEYSF